jgi:hypothetical protein
VNVDKTTTLKPVSASRPHQSGFHPDTGILRERRNKQQEENIDLFYSQSLFLKTPGPIRGAAGQSLESYRHFSQPSWVFTLTSDRKGREVRRYLISKYLLGRLRSSENLILLSQCSENSLLSNLLLWRRRNGVLSEQKRKDWIFSRAHNLARRIRNGTPCTFNAFKEWRPIVIAEERRIGVGYKDHGSLASAPSWKDQIIFTEEDTEVEDDVIFELWTLLSFLEYLKG